MRIFTFLLLLLISFTCQAQQPCRGPGRIPATANPVCGTLVFHQQDVPDCTGPDLPEAGCGQAVTTSHSVWYKFHCYQSGTLGFLITPASLSDDYDWCIMDVTGHAPSDVLITNLSISLNISGVTGLTGCSATGTLNLNCGGTAFDPFNQLADLVVDHDYLLMVTNWSNSGLGYDLSFSGGTAVITNPLPPSVSGITGVGCNNVLKIVFPEDILCSSITANGSEFTITNGTHPITSVASVCSGGLSTFTQITMNLQDPLPPGNYHLVIGDGTDGNTLLNVCQAPVVAGTSFDFNIPVPNPPAITNISFTGCAPNKLKVTLSKPILCSSISSTGSEFHITPGNPVISSVLSACNTGGLFTNTIDINLQDRLPFGNYQLEVGAGPSGSLLADTCGNPIVSPYQFPFVINQTTTAPAIQSILFDECRPNTVVVNFDKPVDCNSFSNSEFSVTPGSHPIFGVVSNCFGSSPYTTQFIITLANLLPAGNFNVNINTGTDGNTLSDTCFSFVPANSTKSFVTTQAPAPTYDSLQYEKCTPSEIKIFYSHPIDCGTVFIPGIEFYITGPTPVNIVSVSGDPATCSTSYSNWLILHLSQPINNLGTYVLHNRWGPDGNSVADTCWAPQDTTETISFNVLGRPSAVFNDQIRWGCKADDTLSLSHPGGNGINSWQWNFSDNTTASGPSVSHNFPDSTVTATVQLIVSNGICTDTLQRSYTLNNAFKADFIKSADTICITSKVEFTNNSTGNNLQYLWQFGDNTTFGGQTPSPHIYSSNNDFDVNLIVNNDHGCIDTSTQKINVTKEPVIDFAGLNTQYCTGDILSLTANMQGFIDSYEWYNGNGIIFKNEPVINFSYALQSVYTISLTATDRFCGVSKKDSTTKVFRIPDIDLGPDKSLCPGITLKLGSVKIPGYIYLWSNGSDASQVITSPQSNTYKLTIDNNGCIADDQVFIEMLDHCLIRVPGAFTPNKDGMNDKLKAINAELATSFLLRVYNRFGQLMFSTTDPVAGWDGIFKGNPAETGTYVWQLSYIDPESKKPVYQKGTSVLIR